MDQKPSGMPDRNTPQAERIYMGEGHRLPPECPSRMQLTYAATIGVKHNGRRIKLPTRKSGHRRWTTASAYWWWNEQLQD